jgi:hypothetical protein
MEKIARGWKRSEGVGNGRQRIGSNRTEYGGTGEIGSPLTEAHMLNSDKRSF